MTDETLIILLAFGLGFLSRSFIPSYVIRDLQWQITSRLPQRCPRCKTWRARRDLVSARHDVAGWVSICENCHDELYHPTQRS